MNEEKEKEELEKELEIREKKYKEILVNINPEFHEQCKNMFEQFFSSILAGKKIEITVVIDANIIISEAIVFVRSKKSYLLELIKSPYFNPIAPEFLLEELKSKQSIIAKEKKIDEKELETTFAMFTNRINIVKKIDLSSYQKAEAIIGQKDKKDVDYLGLFISFNAHAILSKDSDFDVLEQVWERPGVAGRFVSILESGSVSFAIVGTTSTIVFVILSELIVSILRAIWKITKFLAVSLLQLVQIGFSMIENLPIWALILLGLVAIKAYYWEKENKKIMTNIRNKTKIIKDLLREAYDFFKTIFNSLAPILEKEMLLWGKLLLKQINDSIDTYTELDPILKSVSMKTEEKSEE